MFDTDVSSWHFADMRADRRKRPLLTHSGHCCACVIGMVAGYDWRGRAACVAAALWPERYTGLVWVNS